MLSIQEKEIICGQILNDSNKPLKERFRALFTLKNIGGSFAIEQIQKAFSDPSALLKRELTYCLGQMQDSCAIPVLVDVLKDKSQEPMVRHEAGEALGTIGDTSAISVLKEYSRDPTIEVAETCELALKRLKWIENQDETEDKALSKNPYASVDPAPPAKTEDIKELSAILLDEKTSLFERYLAMFSLRNLRTEESVLYLFAKGLMAGCTVPT